MYEGKKKKIGRPQTASVAEMSILWLSSSAVSHTHTHTCELTHQVLDEPTTSPRDPPPPPSLWQAHRGLVSHRNHYIEIAYTSVLLPTEAEEYSQHLTSPPCTLCSLCTSTRGLLGAFLHDVRMSGLHCSCRFL